MKKFLISGIQQMGIGVCNVQESWKWYIKEFGMDCRIFEEEAEAYLMLPFTGGEPRRRHAILALNLQSGGGFEIWQHLGREPLMPSSEIMIGDLGILVCKMKVKKLSDAYNHYRCNGSGLLGSPAEDPSGTESFFLKDPYGNIFQILEADDWFMNEKKISGGSYGAMIGVSDIEKSRIVYSDILGYDEVVYDETGFFPDLEHVPGGSRKCRRVLLRRSEPFAGPFSRIFGNSVIELVSTPGNPGKKTYEGRLWGDPGFMHLCFDIRGMDALREHCDTIGFPFLVDSMSSQSGSSFDMGEAAGHFAYVQDPDGVLIEFVETHKIALVKKLGWYIDLRKRDQFKPLPDWLLRFLRYSRFRG